MKNFKWKDREDWSEDEIMLLKDNYNKIHIKDICKILNRTESSIKTRAYILKLTSKQSRLIYEQIKLKNIKQMIFKNESIGFYYAGYIAGEGCFTYSQRNNSKSKRFRFSLYVSDVDRKLIYDIYKYLKVGSVILAKRRNPKWRDEVHYIIFNNEDIWKVLIPFMDKFEISNSNKRKQYNKWKDLFIKQYKIKAVVIQRKNIRLPI